MNKFETVFQTYISMVYFKMQDIYDTLLSNQVSPCTTATSNFSKAIESTEQLVVAQFEAIIKDSKMANTTWETKHYGSDLKDYFAKESQRVKNAQQTIQQTVATTIAVNQDAKCMSALHAGAAQAIANSNVQAKPSGFISEEESVDAKTQAKRNMLADYFAKAPQEAVVQFVLEMMKKDFGNNHERLDELVQFARISGIVPQSNAQNDAQPNEQPNDDDSKCSFM